MSVYSTWEKYPKIYLGLLNYTQVLSKQARILPGYSAHGASLSIWGSLVRQYLTVTLLHLCPVETLIVTLVFVGTTFSPLFSEAWGESKEMLFNNIIFQNTSGSDVHYNLSLYAKSNCRMNNIFWTVKVKLALTLKSRPLFHFRNNVKLKLKLHGFY